MIIFKLLHLGYEYIKYLLKKDYNIIIVIILLCINVKKEIFKLNMHINMLIYCFFYHNCSLIQTHRTSTLTAHTQ